MARGRLALRADRRGVVGLEFAMVASLFVLLILGGANLGLLWWTRNVLQLTASLTARCAALNACTDPGAYAAAMADGWFISGAVTKTQVTTTTQSSCYGTSGYTSYVKVTITAPYWSGLK